MKWKVCLEENQVDVVFRYGLGAKMQRKSTFNEIIG